MGRIWRKFWTVDNLRALLETHHFAGGNCRNAGRGDCRICMEICSCAYGRRVVGKNALKGINKKCKIKVPKKKLKAYKKLFKKKGTAFLYLKVLFTFGSFFSALIAFCKSAIAAWIADAFSAAWICALVLTDFVQAPEQNWQKKLYIPKQV